MAAFGAGRSQFHGDCDKDVFYLRCCQRDICEADDTTLLASSRESVTLMITKTEDMFAEHGLCLKAEQLLFPTNKPRAKLKPFRVDSATTPMVSAWSRLKVLGSAFNVQGCTAKENDARISAARANFHQLHAFLCHGHCVVTKRLWVFDMCVGQTSLWCCRSWICTQTENRRLSSTQNYMLRRIAAPKHAEVESYVDWTKKVTRKARDIAKQRCAHVGR